MSTLFDALKKAEKIQQNQKAQQGHNAQNVTAPGKSKGDIPIVVVVLLAIILVFVIFRAVAMLRAGNSAKQKADSVAMINQQVANALINPQQPVVSTKKTYVGQELEGVICNGETCTAVINGRLLKLQETIDSLIVTKILPKSVELRNPKDDSTTTIELK